jgi:Arm DNA-binding domain/Phage integrase central domain
MLTIKEIQVLDKPGMYGDGDGLYVQVKPAKNGVRKSWVFRYALAGRTRYMGHASYPEVSAAAAREKVRAARKLLADGIDPIVQRDTELANTQTAQKTFREAAEAYYAAKHMPWSKQTQRVFGYIFTNHVFPVIGDMRVADVRKGDILRVLKNTEKYPAGFWYEKAPTAKRCQGIIKAIFGYAITHDLYPQGLNPAEWNILKGALPKPQEINPTENHPALPWRRIGEFMAHLREIGDRTIHGNDRQAVSAWVMELQILTAARPGEAAGQVERDSHRRTNVGNPGIPDERGTEA